MDLDGYVSSSLLIVGSFPNKVLSTALRSWFSKAVKQSISNLSHIILHFHRFDHEARKCSKQKITFYFRFLEVESPKLEIPSLINNS